MPDEATGRTKGVTASGSFSGLSHIFLNTFSGMAPPRWEQNLLTIRIAFLDCYILFQTALALPVALDPIPATRELQLSCYTGPGFGTGTSDTDSVTHDFDTTIPATLDWQESLNSGTWSVTAASMEEILRYTDTGDYPTYGGNKVFDPPYERIAQYIDRTKDGNMLTVTATLAGMSVSAAAVITGSLVRYVQDYPLNIQVTAEGRGKFASQIGVREATINLAGNNAVLSGGLSAYDGLHDIIIDGPTGKVLATASSLSRKTYASAVFYPDNDINLAMAFRAMEQAYPLSVNIRADLKRTETNQLRTVNDGDSLTITQSKYEFGGNFYELSGGGSTTDLVGVATPSEGDRDPTTGSTLRPTTLSAVQPTPITLNERYPLRFWIDRDWIAGIGEQQDDWRILVKGVPFNTFVLEQDSEETVKSTVSSATGTSDLTISLPAGSTSSALQGSAFAGVSFRGYRYLRVNARASANEAVTLSIGGKSWNLSLTTSYADYDIDLCSPDNATADTDATDTQYPLPTSDGPYWGVSAASSIIISNISAGVTVDVASVKLRRSSYSRVTCLHPFPQEWVAAGDTSEYVPRIVDGDTDGRRSREDIHFYRTPVGSDLVYFSRTLSEVIDSIDTGSSGGFPTDGWHATAETVFQDGFHTNAQDACFLWGGGLMRRNGAWSYGFDLSAESALEVLAQVGWDSVEVTPWFGDGMYYTDGDFDGPAQLAIGKIFRGQAAGLVFGEDAEPEAGVTVEIEDGSEGVTGTNGAYQTGLPNPKGGTTQDVTAQAGDSPPTVSVTFPARKRKRACFRVTNTPSGVGYLYNDRHGQTHLSVVTSDGLRYYRADTALPIPGWAVNGVLVTEDAERRAPMVLDWRERVVMLVEFGGDTYEVFSDDDVATWSGGTMAIPGGTMPFIISDDSGNLLEAAYISGNIQARFRAPGDTAWSDLFTFEDENGDPLEVEEECFSLTPTRENPDRYLLAVRISGETDTSLWYSSDDGRTWRRQV